MGMMVYTWFKTGYIKQTFWVNLETYLTGGGSATASQRGKDARGHGDTDG